MTFHQKSRSYFIKLYELPSPPPNQVKDDFAKGEWIPFFFWNALPKKNRWIFSSRVTVILSWSTLRLKKGRWSALKEITFRILLVMSMWFMIELWIRTSQNKTGKTQRNQARSFSFLYVAFSMQVTFEVFDIWSTHVESIDWKIPKNWSPFWNSCKKWATFTESRDERFKEE